MRQNQTITTIALLFGVSVHMSSVAATADTVADFYQGKIISIIDGNAPGGGYGLHATLLTRHLGKHIPGNPKVIYGSMPGAGTLTMTNHVYNIAPKDGTVIGAPSNSAPFAPLLGTPAARFDVTKFSWLPSPSSETGLLIVTHDAQITTIEDMTRKELLVGISSHTSVSALLGRVLNDVLNTKIKLICCYRAGPSEVLMAMERGEVAGFMAANWSSLKALKPEALAQNRIKLIAQYGLRPDPELPNVPLARDSAKSAEDRQLLDASMASLLLGRPYMLPPGVPPERVAAMRKAFMATFNDPQYRAEADQMKLDIDASPKTGEEVQEIIDGLYKAPEHVVMRLRALYEAGQNQKE